MEGNQMKMREALEGLARAVRAFMATKGANFYPDFSIALEAANAALSSPPRNCDVGTAGEQGERCMAQFDQWRRKGEGKKLITVIMEWAQMPYKAEEGGEK